jgi:hypothetical protein
VSLPFRYATIAANGSNYYYADGVYFQPQGSSYVVVSAPTGAVVSSLPSNCITVYDIDGYDYCYYGGTFYAPTNNGYEVVIPPPGTPVPFLPRGYRTITSGGTTYYEYAGVRYEPYYKDGEVVYVIAS